MVSSMEGNWHLLPQPAVKKPIFVKGSHTFKRTFPLDHTVGVQIQSAASMEELVQEQHRMQYTGIKLMRGLWEEQRTHSSGTYFPVAAPEGTDMLCSSAGHCLMGDMQQRWRCGYGQAVLPCSVPPQPTGRIVLDLGWLTEGQASSDLAEHMPSQPTQRIAGADVVPDFGFMLTKVPEGGPHQLFIPSVRQLVCGEPVCVLGFAHRPTAEWARTFLRTEADYNLAVQEASLRHQQRPSASDWRLDDKLAMRRALDLLDDVCYPSLLVASPGLVAGASDRIIEHTCSTFPGMSGGPGVDVQHPWQLLFVHTRAGADFRCNNYGCSVHHPLFVKAYEREVLPRLLATPPELLSKEMLHCLRGYLDAHKHQLSDHGMLREVEQRC